ncbi:MAG: metallophosphoesterase [Thermoproteota archaeon]|jgi:DNA repair exonuclease SbcCD nuclease subunit
MEVVHRLVRVAHISDTHLGFRQYNLDEREADIYNVMEDIADKILKERAEIVVHTGDLFDSSRPTARAYYAFKKFLAKLEGKVSFFSILGDHDLPKRRDMSPQKLFEDKIYILGAGSSYYKVMPINGQEILIAGISYIGQRYNELLKEELKQLDSVAAGYSISILMLHQAIDKFFSFEGLYDLRMDELPRNFSYYAMGHLHKRIRSSLGKGELAYAGSTEIIRSDEIQEWKDHGKGFYLVDIEKDKVEVNEINLESIRPQLKVKLNYDGLEHELKKFVGSFKNYSKKPVVHISIEGKQIDRQEVYQLLNEVLSNEVLYFRYEVHEEEERKLEELKAQTINIKDSLKEYFGNDEELANFSYELFQKLRYKELDEAKEIADEFLKKVLQNDTKKGKT